MKNQEIKFKSKKHNYSIIIGRNTINILPKKIKLLCPNTKKIALIVDENIPSKFKNYLRKKLKNYNLLFLQFKANEKNKSLQNVNFYLDTLFENFVSITSSLYPFLTLELEILPRSVLHILGF